MKSAVNAMKAAAAIAYAPKENNAAVTLD